jgi:hypothetical protein
VAQLNVPGAPPTGADAGADIIVPPSSQHGAGPQAGAHSGAQAGIPHGSACRRHGERNSMNDCRPPPKQLLHPGAATRLPRTSVRHSPRVMIVSSMAGGIGGHPIDGFAPSVTTPQKP